MKNEKKLTAQDIVNFFQEKPTFNKSETDASILYGWPSTREGFYSITDIYKYFDEKGFDRKDVEDVIYKFFQKQDAFGSKLQKMDKGKTHNIFLYNVYSHNPDYKTNFVYYFYDLTKEEVLKLRKEYESESFLLMQTLIEKRKNSTKNCSAAKKAREKKKTKSASKADKPKIDKPKADKPKSERRVKKPALIEE